MATDCGSVSPEGSHVNDWISSSLAYVSIDNPAMVALALGKGCFLGKCDVRCAYQYTPRTGDFWGCSGRGRFMWTWPIHLVSAQPQRFPCSGKCFPVGTYLECSTLGVSLHYIDDFTVLGKTQRECGAALGRVIDIADRLGFPMELTKAGHFPNVPKCQNRHVQIGA